MRVLELPPSLGYRDVEVLYRAVAAGEPLLFDARRVGWVHPTGMVALLAAGKVARDRSGVAPKLTLPEGQKGQQVTSYLGAAGFFRAASEVFDSPFPWSPRRTRRPTDTLLEITPITTNSDVHKAVDKVQSQAEIVLSERLRYPKSALFWFSVILSEVCQNIVEHAEASGWVAAQAYKRMPGLPRAAVVLAVSDLGRGFQASLAERLASRFADRWGDATALDAAFNGETRFPDTGRGQGIRQIRQRVKGWKGLFSIRSGTARIAHAPEWGRTPPMEERLTPFPGAHVNIVIPDRAEP